MTTVKKLEKAKKRVFEIIQIGNQTDVPSLVFDIFIVCVIVLNIIITFCQTFAQLARYNALMQAVEMVTIVIFTVEYVLRVWTAQYLYPEQGRGRAKLKFALSFYGIVDLMTILPYFLPFVFPSGAVAFRMFRVVRILRLFRINARYDAFHVITTVLREKRDQLMYSIFLVLVLMMASSLCMYGLEHEAQPEHFANAFSGIWWSVSTLLTVGYGDIYPITVGGQVMAIVIAFLGVGMVAIPTGIISAGFVEYYTRIKKGTAASMDADFVTLEITLEHPFIGQTLEQLTLPQGLYTATVLRSRDVLIPQGDLRIQAGDIMVLGSMSHIRIEAGMEEVAMEKGHPWIGMEIRDLDISRRSHVIMLKRGNKNIRPQGDSRIRERDVVLIYHR
ncbi:MAG: ion transporter [Lachnospiraceae bacterium]|nr:ion transporter [Lachnospiraceae bacterium]